MKAGRGGGIDGDNKAIDLAEVQVRKKVASELKEQAKGPEVKTVARLNANKQKPK